MVTVGDTRNCIRVLLYSYYTTIAGWGILLRITLKGSKDTYFKAFGPSDHTIKSFWAILSLRLTFRL